MAGHDKITFERMSNLARERPWARPVSSSQTCNPKLVLPITDKSSGFSSHGSQREPEPLVWVHQTELFETASSSQAFPRSPYEGVLDLYPDVSVPTFSDSFLHPSIDSMIAFLFLPSSSSRSHRPASQTGSDMAALSQRSTSTSLFTTGGCCVASSISEAD